MEDRECNVFALSSWTADMFHFKYTVDKSRVADKKSKQSQRNRQEEFVNIKSWFLESVFLFFTFIPFLKAT